MRAGDQRHVKIVAARKETKTQWYRRPAGAVLCLVAQRGLAASDQRFECADDQRHEEIDAARKEAKTLWYRRPAGVICGVSFRCSTRESPYIAANPASTVRAAS